MSRKASSVMWCFIPNLLMENMLCTPVHRMDLLMQAVDLALVGLVDDMTNARISDEKIVDQRYYHTIKELKNGRALHLSKHLKDGYILLTG